MEDSNKITYFAETDHRGKVPFGIKVKDRSKHVYVIGKTGMGKSTMLENMAVQDIQNGNGMCFVDPHGKTAELLLEYVPKERIDDVIYFAPFDMENPVSFNIMEDVGYDKRHLVMNGLMSAFKKIWVDAWSARMEYILSNVIMALLEYPDSTLLGVNRMLTDKAYRKKVVDNITDPSTKSFWVDEFAKYTDRYTADATPAIQNKVGQFTANPLIRNIIGQPKSSFNLRDVMDKKKILIINLSKGRIGEGNANLLGSMLITKLYLSAMSRADMPESELQKMPNFYLFVDEFQSFANESFADILSEARKYKLNLTIAHQYIEQMPEEVRSAVFGNVGTMVTFRVGAYDAEVLEKEFAPKFYADDLVNLGFTQIYLKLMIDGVSSHPFSAVTLPPIMPPEHSNREAVIERSRELYAKPRIDIEKAINDWYKEGSVVSDDSVKVRRQDTNPAQSRRLPVKNADRPYADRNQKAQQFQKRLEEKSAQRPTIDREAELRKRIEREVNQSLDERVPLHTPAKKQETTRVHRAEAEPIIEKPQEKMSLSALKKNDQSDRPAKKIDTSQNKDSLRDALKQVLEKQKEIPGTDSKEKQAGHEVKKDTVKQDAPTPSPRPKKEAPPEPKQQEPAQPERDRGPKEVPEEVLRKVLEVKDYPKKNT
jgi:hypothetical protein